MCVYLVAGTPTSPVRCTRLCAGIVLPVIVISLSCKPDLVALLNTTLITPLSPGLTGSFGHSGMVQPHEATALVIINGDLPVLVNLKSYDTLSPCFMVPKL